MSNVGRWNWYYKRKPRKAFGYSQSDAFQIGAEWLRDCERVADWGCGGGMFREHIGEDRYIGVDGSETWAVDVVADLSTYRGESDGIFMRNVLEHNYDWQTILDNALASFCDRMALVLFTPFHHGEGDEREIQFEKRYNVPTLSLKQETIERHLAGLHYQFQNVEAQSVFGGDMIYLIER